MCLRSIKMPENQIFVDGRTSSTNCDSPRELSSTEDEHALKVRKPYTITKQRERWSDEEHNKFVEAIKLYGRAWRRIEEHIGTKTTVQIRSHAQKFFSKVVRESADNCEDTLKPVEIPPPRPKRKPKHPYPRKSGREPVLQKLERCLSIEQENRSPKSVLSAFSSDAMGSSASDAPKHCLSSDSSTSGSNPSGIEFTEQANGCQSLVSSSNGEKGTPLAAEAISNMKSDHVPATTSFQLFGKRVFVSPVAENMPLCHKASMVTENKQHQNEEEIVKVTDTARQRMATQEVLCGASCKDSWGAWSYGVPQMLYQFPSQLELVNAARAPVTNPPMLVFYSGMQFPVIQNCSQFCTEASDDEQMQENSWTGSNTEKSGDVVDSNFLLSKPSFDAPKSKQYERARGFVPYKRRMAEREAYQRSENSEEADSHRIKLCL